MPNDRLIAGIVFSLVALLIGFDIGFDLQTDELTTHVVVEVAVLLLSLGGLAYAGLSYLAIMRDNKALGMAVSRAREDALRWKEASEQHMAGLGSAIDRQMEGWGLTGAEKEIGLLILKGLSFKEIAEIRTTSERTVRQQSTEIYRKAGLSGRAEFSAFFLEDLLLPHGDQPTSGQKS